MPDLDTWRTASIIAAAVGQTAFVALYMTFPWWRAFLGRALFFKASTFAVLLDVAVAGRMLDWEHEDITFVALYSMVAAGIWAQFFAFVRTKRREGDR